MLMDMLNGTRHDKLLRDFRRNMGDYDKTFFPVVRLESVSALLALSVQQGLKLQCFELLSQ